MVEIVIMLAIVIIISAVVLVNFPSISDNIVLQKAVQQFALKLRQIQNQSLAVRPVAGPLGPVVPAAVGIYLAPAFPSRYIIFADTCPAPPANNKIYDAGCDTIMETVNVEKGVQLSELVDETGRTQATVSIVYTIPDGQAFISNSTGLIGESALIKFKTTSGTLVRSVRARTSGQIAIE